MTEPQHINIPAHIHNLSDFLTASFNEFANKPAFTCLGQTLTFAEIDSKSRAFAAWLQQSGLQPGDRVAIQLPNLIQYPIAAYGVLRAGMRIVNTNPMYTSPEMLHQFTNSGAKAIVILQDLTPKLTPILDETAIEQVIVTGATDLLTGQTESVPAGQQGLIDVLAAGADLPLTPSTAELEDVAVLQYTGGTTGVAKGACLTHRNIIANTEQTLTRFGDTCGKGVETFVCPLPLYHSYAFVVNMFMFSSYGNLNILIPNPRDINAFIGALKGIAFTGFAGLNTLFVGLCQHPEFKKLDFSRLQLTTSGGTTLTQAAADIWQQTTGCTISEGYGLSETGPVLSFNQPRAEVIGSVGKPLMDTDIALWDENDQPVAQGEEGQVVARGPQVMKGYWEMPNETAAVLSEDGWFKTGDVGVFDNNGILSIVDRLKDMIIVSGFNVYPNQIEAVLTSHPDILEAAVIGEPSEKTGESVHAYITVKNTISSEAVIEYCKTSLTAYKVPKQVTVLDELPKSTVGKILRRALRQ